MNKYRNQNIKNYTNEINKKIKNMNKNTYKKKKRCKNSKSK